MRRITAEINNWAADNVKYETIPVTKGDSYKYRTYVQLCPICKAHMKEDTDIYNGSVHENYVDCPNGCYSYAFCTGSTSIRVGRVEVQYHYTDDEKTREGIDAVLNLALYNSIRRMSDDRSTEEKKLPHRHS